MMLQCPIPPGGWRTLRLSRAVFLVSSFLSDRPQCGCRPLRGFAGCADPRSQARSGTAMMLRRVDSSTQSAAPVLPRCQGTALRSDRRKCLLHRLIDPVRYLYCLPHNNLVTGPVPRDVMDVTRGKCCLACPLRPTAVHVKASKAALLFSPGPCPNVTCSVTTQTAAFPNRHHNNK